MAGLLLAIPDLVALDLPALAAAAGYPGTRIIPAVSWLLSLLALKLTATRQSPMSMTCSPIPPQRCWPGCRSCRRRPPSPITPTGCRMTTSCLASPDRKRIGWGVASAQDRSLTWTSTPSCTGATTPPWKSTTSLRARNAPAPC